MSDAGDRPERRAAARPRTLLNGILLLGQAMLTIDCAVRNLTDKGARLRLPRQMQLAPPLALLIPSLDKAVNVRVTWRDDCDIGVEFDQALNLDAPVSELEKVARHLWSERRAR